MIQIDETSLHAALNSLNFINGRAKALIQGRPKSQSAYLTRILAEMRGTATNTIAYLEEVLKASQSVQPIETSIPEAPTRPHDRTADCECQRCKAPTRHFLKQMVALAPEPMVNTDHYCIRTEQGEKDRVVAQLKANDPNLVVDVVGNPVTIWCKSESLTLRSIQNLEGVEDAIYAAQGR